MLVSLKEVSKYVDISDLKVDDIASRLTFAGIEVENITKGAIGDNLIVGEIIKCDEIPNSHLHLCKVNTKEEILDIVCGAPNVRVNLKVIVAKVGAHLFNGVEIKKATIKGYESNGMLCSLLELGVNEKSLKKEQIEGIEELDNSIEIGEKNILSILGLDDTILDLAPLANRSDCLSLFNVAKEIGALFKKEVKIPSLNEIKTYSEKEFKVESKSNESLSFYAKIFKDLKISESPLWLKNILMNIGLRSINNVVDIANYVMYLTGQPVHTYDYDALDKKELIIKDDINEEFLALDGKKYNIKSGDLVVTSNNKIVCLGGIIGGENSEITPLTKNIVLEVANFSFNSIRKTSSRLGISTDSSSRFSKGVNPHQSEFVINLFTHLIKEIVDVKEISNTLIFDKVNHEKKVINCSKTYINNRLGTNFSYEEIIDVLKSLYFEIEIGKDKDNFIAKAPLYRNDIDSKADLSEEVIRYKGFDSINMTLPIMETTLGKNNENRIKERIIESFLLDNSLNEVLTYTLINEKDNNYFNFINKNEGLVIFNPLSEDRKFIRKNILSSLLRCAEYNYNRKIVDNAIFEISNCYSINDKEEIHLGIVLIGNKFKQDLILDEPYDFYDLKGIVEGIFNLFNIGEKRIKYSLLKDDINSEFHPSRSCEILLDNKRVTVLGDINPNLKKEYSIKKENCILCEMNLSLLFLAKSNKNEFKEISKYPKVVRDFAFIVSNDINYIEIKKEILKLSSTISEVSIFDIYKGEHLKKNDISLAIKVSYESFDATLKDEDISSLDKKIKECLVSRFKATLRE